jgi:hypothetical protein
VAPAHASARLLPNLSEEGVDPERRVDENVGGAQLGSPFRDWHGNRMKNERLAVPHRKIYPTVHPDWRLTTNDNVAAVKAIPPLTSKGDQHGEDGQVYSPYRTVW